MFRTIVRRVGTPVFLAAMSVPFALALAASATIAASPTGTCVSARVDAPFRLPDGTLHAAATLTLCNVMAFSPVATVHRTYVDGRPAGMFLSHTRRAEAEGAAAPSVLFQRDTAGQLALLGYNLPGERRGIAYRMGERRTTRAAPLLAGAAAPIAIVAAAK